MRLWRYLYGENPLHLLAVLACFAIVGYAVSFWYTDPSLESLLIWFLGAVIGHDLVLYPLYALADQPLVLFRWARRRALPRVPVRVPVINHLRVPVLGSAVLGLIYLPTVTAHAADSFAFAAGHPLEDHYTSWLGITGLLFLISAVVYALRLGGWLGGRLVRGLRSPGADDGRTPAPIAVGAPLAAPAEGADTANGHEDVVVTSGHTPVDGDSAVAEDETPEPAPTAEKDDDSGSAPQST